MLNVKLYNLLYIVGSIALGAAVTMEIAEMRRELRAGDEKWHEAVTLDGNESSSSQASQQPSQS
jgi:hypothetical protein